MTDNLTNKSFRISLTENCNYKCFFCHEEGMDMGKKRAEEKTDEDIKAIVKTAISKGYNDLTFTGGEPLIKKKLVIDILKDLNVQEIKPDVTIVTNGVLIDEELINEILKYKGKFKFNISMHHLDKEKYFDIVVPKDNKKENFDVVIKNIKLVVERGIYVKLNFVILNGINNSLEDLEKILDFSAKIGVNRVKFLEFLVTDKLLNLYKYYFTLESLKERLKDKLKFIEKDVRTEYYKVKNSNLEVELSHCTCGVGCSNCFSAKDLTITSELKYYPCFFRSTAGYDLSEDFDKGVSEGNRIIAGFTKEYGDKTPFKVSARDFTGEKIEYLYYIETQEELQEFVNELEKAGFSYNQKRAFKERIYGEEGCVKAYRNSYEHNYIEVVKNTEIIDNCLKTQFIFGKDKRIIEDIDKYEKYLELLGVKKKKEVEWSLDYYINKEKEVSIGKTAINKMYFVVFNYINDKFSLSKMDKSIEKTIMEE